MGEASMAKLRVVFQTRDGQTRQLLNMEELVQSCNKASVVVKGITYRFVCSSESFSTVQLSAQQAQQADILIGVHGAALANGWMMRPGSSVIEIIPWDSRRGNHL